jgi:ATP-dependent exoDNAse (exonuclease V) beta subunit
MKWNKLYEYPRSIRSLVKNERHYEIGSEKLPSVTTILSATASDEKQASLAKWKAKVGEVEAERVKNTAATRGTFMHSYLEHHLNGQGLLDLSDEGQAARSMAQTIIDKGLGDLHEIWGNEVVLHYPDLYAGQTDLVGIYQGRDSIIDFKQSNKPKQDSWIEDYYLQGAAYATAHDCIYGTNIEQTVILICTPNNFFQRFIVNGDRFRHYKSEWLKRVDKYYTLKKKILSPDAPV